MQEVRAPAERTAVAAPAEAAAAPEDTFADDSGGRVRAQAYPGEWRDLRRAARRRHLRRGLTGWAAAVMMLAVSACTTTVAVTAGGLVGYAGYSIYRLAEAGRSWTAATYEFLFTPRKSEPPPKTEDRPPTAPTCSWGDRLRARC